jgi:hypothetical protein
MPVRPRRLGNPATLGNRPAPASTANAAHRHAPATVPTRPRRLKAGHLSELTTLAHVYISRQRWPTLRALPGVGGKARPQPYGLTSRLAQAPTCRPAWLASLRRGLSLLCASAFPRQIQGSQSSPTFFIPSNSLYSNHLPPRPAFSPACLRLPSAYNRASGGLRESEFAPRKASLGHACPTHPRLTFLFSTKPSEIPGHACPKARRYGRNYASTPRVGRHGRLGRPPAAHR